ncbi:cytochrome c oxidase subunit 3 family protein [Streptomyces sp. NPDC051016]|uniref:cytochrome c oxidase subunit 3 family protein n=1 Tax=Streptomyces sp. NPDC051016 TaxID=3365638 RepID=UPI0037AA5131
MGLTTTGRGRPRNAGRLPGVEGIWVFLGADLVIFCVLFVSFMKDRTAQPALFERSRLTLSHTLGGADTLILLTSSWLVALAVEAARGDEPKRSRICLAGGSLAGAVFVLSKSVEYGEKFAAGVTPATDSFFMWYFTLTGMHLAHVVVGSCLLAALWARSRKSAHGDGDHVLLESVASFWHLVDLLWIIMFPLLYLTR